MTRTHCWRNICHVNFAFGSTWPHFRFRTLHQALVVIENQSRQNCLLFFSFTGSYSTHHHSEFLCMSYHVLRINCKIRFWILLVSLISPHKNEISHSSFKKWKFFFWCASLFSKHNIIQTSSSFYAGYGPENHKNEGMWVVIFPKT